LLPSEAKVLRDDANSSSADFATSVPKANGSRAAALRFKPSLFAGAKRVNPDSWALFSDIHLAGDTNEIQRGVNMAEHFKTGFARVAGVE